MIYIKTRGPADAKNLLTFMRKDLKAPWSFQTIKTPDAYAKRFGRTHRVLTYDPETQMTDGRSLEWLNIVHPEATAITVGQFKKMAANLAAQRTQPFVKSPPAFLMGFEIEGCVCPDYRAGLIQFMRDLYPGIGDASLIHHDGSIRPKNRAIEIVTPPLPIDEAIERAEWLFGLLSILSDESAFATNHTTGLHVNISETKSFSWANREARARFTCEFMKRLDPVKWRSAFRRTTNKYCPWFGTPETPADLVKHSTHWSAVNTEHLNDSQPQNRRVEVRVAGGKDYHAKSERLNGFLLDIRRAAHEAYDSI